MKADTHEDARRLVECILELKGKTIADWHTFDYPPEFVKKHHLGTPSKPNTSHSFDILTADHIIIEIDDLGKHSHKAQKINDGIVTDYAANYLQPKGYIFFRLLKEELVNEKGVMQPTAASYLRANNIHRI